MRALFLLLLLANLLFAAWALWIAPAPAESGYPATTAGGQGAIRLLREVPATPASTAPSVALDDAGLACVSAGPFLERPAAEQAAARLAQLGFTTRLRAAREPAPVGTWVRLEGLATPEDAANAQAALRAAGLAEAYVLTEEDVGNVVSVGVYAEPDKAAEAAAAVRAAGFEPVSGARLREEDVTWLEVDRQSNGGLPTLEQLQAAAPQGAAALQLQPCPEAAPADPGGAVQAPAGPAGAGASPGPAAPAPAAAP